MDACPGCAQVEARAQIHDPWGARFLFRSTGSWAMLGRAVAALLAVALVFGGTLAGFVVVLSGTGSVAMTAGAGAGGVTTTGIAVVVMWRRWQGRRTQPSGAGQRTLIPHPVGPASPVLYREAR